MRIIDTLNQIIKTAMLAAGAPDEAQAQVIYATRPDYGDYQANGIMSVAKKMGQKPRELADKVIEKIEENDLIEKVEIAGPGFINIFISKAWLNQQLSASGGEAIALLNKAEKVDTVVVDYSGPNLAKEMHVGHLRSTIIGDAIAKVLELIGHKVIRQNHVGDWGTQFGMLIAYLDEVEASDESLELKDLELFYRNAKKRFDEDESFAQQARKNVVDLQSGDEKCLSLWSRFIEKSMAHCLEVYERLGLSLDGSHTRAESFYNDSLRDIVKDLETQNLLEESDGAQCVFLDGFETKEGDPLPVIVQKSDGGFLYATTDLAALRFRATTLKANRILYFVDARQALHFQQVFTLAKLATFVPEDCVLEHMPFGNMLGQDKKPFKTRSGELVKLSDLLDEAESRALNLINEKQADLSEEEKRVVAKQVGLGSVKYADLSKNRTSDYVFRWDTMLTFEGNTAPYLQYAYARIKSIFRKLEEGGEKYDENAIKLNLLESEELALGLKILQLGDQIDLVAKEGFPHILCKYVYELTQAYMGFYERCPVLQEDKGLQGSRLYLCALTASNIALCLELLGIETPESM